MAIGVIHCKPFGASGGSQFTVGGNQQRIRTPHGAATTTQVQRNRQLHRVIATQAMPTDQCHRISNARQRVFQKNQVLRKIGFKPG